MEFKSINPYNGEILAVYNALTSEQLHEKLKNSASAFAIWKKVPLTERIKLMVGVGENLRNNRDTYAEMITREMGKPIVESRNEISKCAWLCDYYVDNAEVFLADEKIDTEASLSFVRNEPIGAVLAIMPWNFPFWQVFRFAVPNLLAGNTALLKHAPNVFGCASLIEEIFDQANFPKGVFQRLIVHHDKTEEIIANDVVQAVTLTGSERAGSTVASLAGKYIKKTVLELGGNNAFIVWEDANLDETIEKAIPARMLNTGQSCIAAKRFILMEGIYDAFVTKFIEKLKSLRSGDPMNDETQVGPLARKDLADQLHRQINESIKAGAKLLYGGDQKEAYHEPTVLGDVHPNMAAFKEETFGPLAAMIKVKTIEEAFQLSEQSRFGLGVTVCTKNTEKALKMTAEISDGAYFINEFVKSDPRLPFGGTKYSGYGRELAKDGILEFVNRKTVYVK